MDYIISPSWFYWVNLINNLSDTICVISYILFLTAGCIFIMGIVQYMENENNIYEKFFQTKTIKIAIKIFVISMIFLFIYIILPDQNTLIQMKLAEFGTYDNIKQIAKTIEYMLDKLN